MAQCSGLNRSGERCRNEAVPGSEFCHIKSHANGAAKINRVYRFLQRPIVVVATILIAIFGFPIAVYTGYKQSLDERQAALAGTLSPVRSVSADLLSVGGANFRIGAPDGAFLKDGNEPLLGIRRVSLRGANCLWLWHCATQVLVNAKLRQNGLLIAEIRNSEWSVQPKPSVFDRNFNDHVLEVLDSSGEVGLQVIDLGETVRVAGKLTCSQDETTIVFGPVPTGAVMEYVRPPNRAKLQITPVCKYPSDLHLGECDISGIKPVDLGKGGVYYLGDAIDVCPYRLRKSGSK